MVACMPTQITSSGSFEAHVQVPGDKSISHRAFMFAALARGTSTITGGLQSEDIHATKAILAACGIEFQAIAPNQVRVHGRGQAGFAPTQDAFYCGNSGTTLRLMTGLLSQLNTSVRLEGDDSLNCRPMRRVTDPLKALHVMWSTSATGTAPLTFHPHHSQTTLRQPTALTLAVPSGQVKTSLILAGLQQPHPFVLNIPFAVRDHTQRMLHTMGYPMSWDTHSIRFQGCEGLHGCDITIPGDFSSAAFHIVAACITPDAVIKLPNVGINPTRTGLLDALIAMGADIVCENQRFWGAEPVADIHVRYRPLRGITVPSSLVVRMIDEFPVFSIACAYAKGVSTITDISELRVKESDRVKGIVDLICALGGAAKSDQTTIKINGLALKGGQVQSVGDHRLAMAAAVAATRTQHPVCIDDVGCVDTSYPDFFKDIKALNLHTVTLE